MAQTMKIGAATPLRATFKGNVSYPPNGALGSAFPANGFSDPESAEFGAYCFFPDDDQENGYYCDPVSDLDFSEVAA